MLEITESALTNVKNYLDQQKIDSAVRVNLMSGCSGPSLGLAIDDAKDNGHIFDHGGVSFLVDKRVAETCGAIKVDFVENKDSCCGDGGFVITSEKPLSGGSCGCSCSSGSCG